MDVCCAGLGIAALAGGRDGGGGYAAGVASTVMRQTAGLERMLGRDSDAAGNVD